MPVLWEVGAVRNKTGVLYEVFVEVTISCGETGQEICGLSFGGKGGRNKIA